MLFVQSLRGLSHTKLEDTKPEHLELAVQALDRLTSKTLDRSPRAVSAQGHRPGPGQVRTGGRHEASWQCAVRPAPPVDEPSHLRHKGRVCRGELQGQTQGFADANAAPLGEPHERDADRDERDPREAAGVIGFSSNPTQPKWSTRSDASACRPGSPRRASPRRASAPPRRSRLRRTRRRARRPRPTRAPSPSARAAASRGPRRASPPAARASRPQTTRASPGAGCPPSARAAR